MLTLAIVAAACGPLAAGSGASAPPDPSTAPQANSPLVGTWTAVITRDDLRAGGITDEGLLDENAGRITWTFDADGTWHQLMESLDGAAVMFPVFDGTYEVAGDEFVQWTTFPEMYAGERLVFGWRIDGDRLHVTVTNPSDDILPVLMETHPWERVQP